MSIFKDWESFYNYFPGPAKMIELENEIQCPHARFLVGGIVFDQDQENLKDVYLSVFFDLGTPNMVLWILISGDVYDPKPNRGSYIDEYYELPINEAAMYHGDIYNQRIL